MGVKQGLGVVLDAAEQMREQRDIAFLLTGDGAMKPHLENKAQALKLNNVRFLPLQEQAEFLQMLAAVDVALIVQQSSVSDIAFPVKDHNSIVGGETGRGRGTRQQRDWTRHSPVEWRSSGRAGKCRSIGDDPARIVP